MNHIDLNNNTQAIIIAHYNAIETRAEVHRWKKFRKIMIDFVSKKIGVILSFQGTQEGFGSIPSSELYNIMDGPAKGTTIAIRDFSPEAIEKKINATINKFLDKKI